MEIIEYDRKAAVTYAKKWAFGRNPDFYNFDRIGGDCTNFASQCLYAGAGTMNYTPVLGWFYISVNDRTASWTGVEYFYNFLIGNKEAGPFGEEVKIGKIQIGDFIQLGRATGDFYHTPIVCGFYRGEPLVAAHTNDVYNRPLSSYFFEKIRCIHIVGVRRDTNT